MPDIKYHDHEDFPYRPTSLGRNGMMKTVGLAVGSYKHCATIEPVNTKGVGRCWIDVPLSAIPDLIYALENVYNGTVKDEPHNQ